MGRIKPESFRLVCPCFTDRFIGCEAFERLQPAREIVGADEVSQVGTELLMAFIMEPLDGGLLDRSVHPFDLAVGPWMSGLGQAMVNIVLGTRILERMSPNRLTVLDRSFDLCGGRADISRRCEVRSVVGQHDMDLVRNGLDQGFEKVSCDTPGGLLVQLDEGKLRGPIDGDQKIELSLFGTNLSDIDVKIS